MVQKGLFFIITHYLDLMIPIVSCENVINFLAIISALEEYHFLPYM